ncbi:MAG: CopG family transcriptional regulator [Nitrospirae bacterium]|nr:CopG family transcriptional regulator [Nitrospirota bacterium]MBF0344569.1 CopG family transcriptional regulator [Nitrospirota bacterium]
MPRPKRDNVEREIFSIRVDADITRQYRHMAIDMKVSLSELVERALRQYLSTTHNQTGNLDTPI